MNRTKTTATLPEMLLQIAELFDEYANICEQKATEITKEIVGL